MMHKILLIDDDKTMITLLSKLLQFEGFNVISFDGQEDLDAIVDLVRRESPAIILIDVNLKDINGFDVLNRVHIEKGLPDTRIIMSSGMDFNSQSLSNGAHGFIQKPYMPEELVEKINQILSSNPLIK